MAYGNASTIVHSPGARGVGTVRYPRLVPKDEPSAEALAVRTLTNLYNERPTWRALAIRSSMMPCSPRTAGSRG